ncbi:MAG: hypothetical protein ACYC3A_09535 [Halothiobacillus sp.]
MRVAVFSCKPYDRDSLTCANVVFGHELAFFDAALTAQTCSLAEDAEAV